MASEATEQQDDARESPAPRPPDAAPAVEAKGVSVTRDGRALLDAVDLLVARRSIHAIVGPNGAGKSTLLAALLGQIDFRGEVRFRFTGSATVAYVPQTFAVDRTLPLTVLDFLALSRQRWPVCFGVAKSAAATCAALLDRVKLGGFEDRPLGALSGGELRRVLLANALDPVPELVLLDEPSTGLDRAGVVLMEALLTTLRDEHGTTVVLVSHEASQVRRVADAVTWIERRVRGTGTVAEVLGERGAFPFAEDA